jgi:hypothetical protein
MKVLGHMLLFTVIALLLLALGWKLWSHLSVNDPLGGNAGFRDVLRSTTYEVPSEGWIEFPLPNKNGLRLVTTALVGTDDSLMTEERWGYTLAYQLFDRSGETIKEWTYHYRTGVTRYVDPDTGRYQPRSYVADIHAVPADSRVMQVVGKDLTGATGLRIRLLDRHPGLQQVLVRCYTRESVAEHKLTFLWQRMDAVKRERIAAVSVFGAEFIREQEQYNLLRWEWSPIGPAGVHDEDYRSRVLFILNDAPGESVDEDVLPEGLYADQLTRGMLELPEGSWDLRLEVVAIDSGVKKSDAQPVLIRWYGKGGMEQWEVSLDYYQQSPYLRESVTAGVLEIVSEIPVIVRVYLGGDGKNFRLQSAPQRLRTYLAQEGQPVDYRVEHVKDAPTPFRVDLRSMWREGEPLARQVHYQLLDSEGHELSSGDIAVDQPLSFYDRISNPVSGERVSDAQRRYFYLPPEVSVLRLSARAPVLTVAYSRPDDLQRQVRVPEDYQNPASDPDRQPAWFMVRPVDHESLRLQQRSLQIVVQSRPPELDPKIAEGLYEWKEYQPNGRWRARELLVPRTTEQPVRDRSRAGVFTPVDGNKMLTLHLQGQTGRQQVAPTLIYVGQVQKPANVIVELDGEEVITTRIFSPRTRLQLPLLPVGKHTLHIRTGAQGVWWMNYTGSGEDGRLLRKVVQLGDDPLHFDYTKQDAQREVMSGVLYCTAPGRVKLRATVDAVRTPGMTPESDWSFLERGFDVFVEPSLPVPVLDTPDVSVSSGQTFFLVLGEDLQAGHYRISMTKAASEPCYLNLHRVIAGQPLLRRFFRERDLLASGENP